MKMLGIDLGTHTGLAYESRCGVVCETKTLATPRELREAKASRLDQRGDIRVTRFFNLLVALHEKEHFDAVIVEDVIFASSTYAVQLWSSLRAAVWLAFSTKKDVVLEFVPVPTIKKFATGSGSAKKEQMASALKKEYPEIAELCIDDNSVDAAWIYLWGQKNLSRKPL